MMFCFVLKPRLKFWTQSYHKGRIQLCISSRGAAWLPLQPGQHGQPVLPKPSVSLHWKSGSLPMALIPSAVAKVQRLTFPQSGSTSVQGLALSTDVTVAPAAYGDSPGS